jgi:hypothetical protein
LNIFSLQEEVVEDHTEEEVEQEDTFQVLLLLQQIHILLTLVGVEQDQQTVPPMVQMERIPQHLV